MIKAVEFRDYVDKENIKIELDIESSLRYYLVVPFKEKKNNKKAIVILKNPSKAKIDHETKEYESDITVNRVLEYFRKKKFSKVIILNLFARYDTYSKELNKHVLTPEELIGKDNDVYIQQQLGDFDPKEDKIVVAWGGYPKESTEEMIRLYDQRILQVEEFIKGIEVHYVDRLVENRFPLHGLAWHTKNPRKLKVYKKTAN